MIKRIVHGLVYLSAIQRLSVVSHGIERSMMTSVRVKTLVLCCLALDNIRWKVVSLSVMLCQVIGTLIGFSTILHHAHERWSLTVNRFHVTL